MKGEDCKFKMYELCLLIFSGATRYKILWGEQDG